jgi:hypothetical protein
MSWRHLKAAANKNTVEVKAGLLADLIFEQQPNPTESRTLPLETVSKNITDSKRYLAAIANRSLELLAERGLSNWTIDLEDSKVPSPWGYGNEATRVIDPNNLFLVAKLATEAQVIALPLPEAEPVFAPLREAA